ncbi:MAG: hypothetical protein QW057_01420 [Candidatus Bathyarchaeia archaeon]
MRAPADGAYDSRRKYAYLAGKGVEPAMKPRGAAPGKPGAAGPGTEAGRRGVPWGLEAWKRRVGYAWERLDG